MMNILSIFCEIAIRWMPKHLTDHYSTLVQVMAWCRQATSHYLSQCWLRSLSPCDVTRPQWVNSLAPGRYGSKLKCAISKLMVYIADRIIVKWKSHDLSDDKSTLFQAVAWYLQAKSHSLNSLNQCKPRSMASVGRGQWVNMSGAYQ